MSNLLHKLACGAVVADGGMGTMLQAAGLPTGVPGELWNVEEPDKIVAIQRQYVQAGSDLLITNTFGGSPLKLSSYGLDDRTEAINAGAAQVARRAAEGTDALVLGDIGPCGGILEPYGDLPVDEAQSGFERQVNGLLQGGVDAFIVETMMDFGEVTCAVQAIRAHSGLPVIVSLFFNKDRQEEGNFRTMFGDTPATICDKASELGIDVVGSNCGMAVDDFVTLAARFREATQKPLIMQPNAGQGRPGEDGVPIYDDPPERMASRVGELYDAGATVVGGCCGTGPEYIRRVREVANARLA